MMKADFGKRYFSRPPRKSIYFSLYTVWLLMLICWSLLLARHVYGRLTGSELEWLLLCVVAPVLLWVRSWRSHAKLHEEYLRTRSFETGCEGSLDVIWTRAADLEMTGLNMALFVLTSALMFFSKILAR